MKFKTLLSVLKLVCAASLFFSLATVPVATVSAAQRASFEPAAVDMPAAVELPADDMPGQVADTGEIVLVANTLVDLKWNPANYPASPGRFKRWELYRGVSPDPTVKIASGKDQGTAFYRDTPVFPNLTYYYRMVVVRCVDPCLTAEHEVSLTFFEDSVTTGVFSGTLYQPLTLAQGITRIGFSTIHSSAVVYVQNGASLIVPPKATLTKTDDISHGAIFVLSGSLSVSGATLSSVAITLGEYDGSQTGCTASLAGVNFVESNLAVNAACSLNVRDSNGSFNVFAADNARLDIQESYIDGSVEIGEQAAGTLTNNHLTGGVQVDGYGASATPKATANLHGNLISSPYHGIGVKAYNGANVTMTENTLSYTGHVNSESSVLLQATDAETKLVALSNRFENGKILLHWNPTVEIKDNVITGNGSAVTIGCPLCGTASQASGSIERNTLQSGWGFEMWDGSQFVTLRNNCIRGNIPGMTVVSTLPTNLDATENFWGDPSGPSHTTNPSGLGDEIVGERIFFYPWDPTGAYCRETPPLALKDLRPIGMEVVQMVQTMENTVPLVAGHPTVVRVYAQSSRGAVGEVKAELKGYHGATLLGTLQGGTKTVQPLTPISDLRRNPAGSWYFRLPPAWTAAGELHLVATINQDGSVTELNLTNNTLERTLPFTARRTLRIAFFPVRYKAGTIDATPTQAQILPLLRLTRHMYPLSDVQAEVIPTPIHWYISLPNRTTQEHYESTLMARLNSRLNALNASRPADQQFDQAFGVFPNAAPLAYCSSNPRWFNDPTTGAAGSGRTAYCIMREDIVAHEIGHNLGLRHPNTPDSCGALDDATDWPYSNDNIQEIGFDVFAFRLITPNHPDVMSYCAPPRWISPFHATKLFNSNGLPQPAPRPAAETTYLFVRGQVTDDGQLSLLPGWQLSMTSPPTNPPEGSTYCIQLQDSSGGLLGSYCFDPQFSVYESGGASDVFEFEFGLPLASGTAKVVVTQEGSIVALSEASAAPPTVTVLYPNGGESLSGELTASWTASDLDGDELFYHLLYSPDGGLTWTPLAEFLSETNFVLDTANLAGSESGLLRVTASDGFHTVQDDSDLGFSTPDNPPLVGIGTPSDGESGFLPLSVSGAAFDLEEGELPGESLEWSSDLDGPLGSGADLLLEELSLGTHTLTVTAADSQGQTGSYSIQFTLVPQPRIFMPAIAH